MNTPFDPHIWRRLESHAAAQLPPDFPDRVLRSARLAASPANDSWFSNTFAVSAATAAICLGAVLFIHARRVQSTNALYAADWQEIAAQTASLEPTP